MIHHSTVSLDYLYHHLTQNILWENGKYLTVKGAQRRIDNWRSQGYTYAPPCGHVLPDGRCAGHEKED